MAKSKKVSTRTARIIIFLFGGIFFCVGGAFTYNTYHFLQNALMATGQVVSVKVSHSDDSTTYTPTFTYLDSTGERQTGTTAISSSGYNFNVGEKMDILYDTRNPSKVRLTGWFNTWGFGVIFMAAGFVPIAISIFIRDKTKTRQHSIKQKSVRDKYVRLESPESEEDHKRETEYTPTVRRN